MPVGLADLEHPPTRLFLWGSLPPAPWVALVGTRRPSPAAARFTHELAADLTRSGVTVVSGGAQGIDAAAHRGALSVGGRTVLVAPSSFDRPYPSEHAELFHEIVRCGGAVISEHEREAVARRHVFFSRNAILVACAAAVVVVQSPLRSGARNAAAWARRTGRLLYAVPHAPWETKGRGCIAELRLGARVFVSTADLLRTLAGRGYHGLGEASETEAEALAERHEAAPGRGAPSPGPRREVRAVQAAQVGLWDVANERPPSDAILAGLGAEVRSLDELHEGLGLSIFELQRRLTELVLAGLVDALPDGRFRAT